MIIILQSAKPCSDKPRYQATIDFIWMLFYYLLRPVEYANVSGDAQHPLCLKNISSIVGAMHIKHPHLYILDQLHASNLTSLTFTTQKNSVKGEKLSHASHGQHFMSTLWATNRCAAHLISHNAPPNTQLHVDYNKAVCRRAVSYAMITSLLRVAALTIPGHVDVDQQNISARSL